MILKTILFSPTGGTNNVVEAITQNWHDKKEIIDLSIPNFDYSSIHISKDDVVLVAMPTYGGHAPALAISRFKQIEGNHAKTILVCTYGNRAYEDTLAQMNMVAKSNNFIVVGAITSIAEHSVSREIAKGRPNENDKKELSQFGLQLFDKISNSNEEVHTIPGSMPSKEDSGLTLLSKPSKNCTHCGLCALKCPNNAIDAKTLKADKNKCISCMRCVSICPQNARKINPIIATIVPIALKKICSEYKNNELFL